ncbi:MAG: monofunctional biosynthetic peptidoglycan transglycosylase [Acidiferrobacterales bacterium]
MVRTRRSEHRSPVLWRAIRWVLRALLLCIAADLIYLASLWPNWQRLEHGAIPETRFMHHYLSERSANHWPRLRWDPVPMREIPAYLQRAVIVAENSRFYEDDGFDFTAIRDAFEDNLRKGRIVYGASTISQQTAKNLFLTPSRTFLRKGNEALLTWGLVHHLGKRRILEIYLNTAEFGRGIYGVEAASQSYWGIPVSQISLAQAAALAASLPSPVRNNPAHRGAFFQHHYRKILGEMMRLYGASRETANSGTKAPNPAGPAIPAPQKAPVSETRAQIRPLRSVLRAPAAADRL